ncbi:MAG: radical SAM protein [Kiritimatiellae bacterium]|nr:radical SAM protein [Kiritimatiellia bacterium]
MMSFSEYAECRLCPRACAVDRVSGQTGVCGETAELRVASVGRHFGEEPPFTGTCGSGTVFFSGCSSHCAFCQNWQISMGRVGRVWTMDELESAVRRMLAEGAHNVNLVSPDHFWPHAEDLVRRLRAGGVAVPVILNTSGYESADMIGRYAESADIFLPDIKFAGAELAAECMGDPEYPEIAFAAVARMIESKGFLHPFDPSGCAPARVGVLVRHLVLPGHAEDSCRVLERCRKEFGRMIPISLMSQYHPVPTGPQNGPLARRLTMEEYEAVKTCAESLEFEHLFIQELRGDDRFLPDFKEKQPFPGNPSPAGH